jgi:hypothetical protein
MYTLANNLEDARLFICITWVGRLLTGFLLHQINSITAEKTSATNGRGSTFLMSPIGAQKAIFLGKVGEQPYVEQPNVYFWLHFFSDCCYQNCSFETFVLPCPYSITES